MTKRLFAATIGAPIAILVSTAAHAESFQGFRVDLHGGYDAVSSVYTVDGATAGVGIGYDFPVGETVIVGVEANLDYFILVR